MLDRRRRWEVRERVKRKLANEGAAREKREIEQQGVTRRLQMYGLDEHQPTIENRGPSICVSQSRSKLHIKPPSRISQTPLCTSPSGKCSAIRQDRPTPIQRHQPFQLLVSTSSPPNICSSFHPRRSSFPLLITYQLLCLAIRVTITLPITSTNSSLTLNHQNVASPIPSQHIQPSPSLITTYLSSQLTPTHVPLSLPAS